MSAPTATDVLAQPTRQPWAIRPRATSLSGTPRTGSGALRSRSQAGALLAQHFAVTIAFIGLPLLKPGGPGNTGGVDLGLLLVLSSSTAWASWSRHPMRFPYVIPISLLVLGGAVAGVRAQLGPLAVLTLGQDLYVLVWGMVLANLVFEPALLRTAVRALGLSGVGWAIVLLIGVFGHMAFLAGITARNGGRASLFLGDPNLASNYFLVTLLALRASGYPRSKLLRWTGCALIVLAMVFTGSNGGAVALIVATCVGIVLRLARTRGAGPALVALLVLGSLGGAAAATVNLQTIALKAQASNAVLRDSIGRQAESDGSRAALLVENEHMYLTDGVIGIGPNETKSTLLSRQAPYVKEAHNDYIATVVERGAIGGAGMLLLLVSLMVRCRSLAFGRLSPAYAAVLPRPELLVAAVIAVLVSGAFYEVLHFRHVWALFGLVAGIDLWARADRHGADATMPDRRRPDPRAGGRRVPARRSTSHRIPMRRAGDHPAGGMRMAIRGERR